MQHRYMFVPTDVPRLQARDAGFAELIGLLNDGWEVVSGVLTNSASGQNGIYYVLRKDS